MHSRGGEDVPAKRNHRTMHDPCFLWATNSKGSLKLSGREPFYSPDLRFSENAVLFGQTEIAEIGIPRKIIIKILTGTMAASDAEDSRHPRRSPSAARPRDQHDQ